MTARFVVGDGEGQVTAVSAGCGIAQLPSWLIKLQLEEGTMVEVAFDVAKASARNMSVIAN